MQTLADEAAATHVDGGTPSNEVGKLLSEHTGQETRGGDGIESRSRIAVTRFAPAPLVHSTGTSVKRIFAAASGRVDLRGCDVG